MHRSKVELFDCYRLGAILTIKIMQSVAKQGSMWAYLSVCIHHRKMYPLPNVLIQVNYFIVNHKLYPQLSVITSILDQNYCPSHLLRFQSLFYVTLATGAQHFSIRQRSKIDARSAQHLYFLAFR
ncbi:MAG: hypothetical protein ACJ70N_01315 [Nitrososphaera sp.]